MRSDLSTQEYKNWIQELKQKFQSSQIKASIVVNSTLLEFYWNLGNDIVEKQKEFNWGSDFLKQLSKDLSDAFPNVKGFSKLNLQYIRRWFLFYSNSGTTCATIENLEVAQVVAKSEKKDWQQVVAKLENETLIRKQVVSLLFPKPWRDNIVIIQRGKGVEKPLGISEYELTEILPKEFKSSLPTVEELENELNKELLR